MFESWFRAHGFVWDEERAAWAIAWSQRCGYDCTELDFHDDGDEDRVEWAAIVGHHASGTNPRMRIGVCTSLDDIQRIYEAILLINGYPGPDDCALPKTDEALAIKGVCRVALEYLAPGKA